MRLAAQVFLRASATPLGYVPVVLNFGYTDRLNELSKFSFEVPDNALGVEHIVEGRDVKIIREDEGIIFYGRIEEKDRLVSRGRYTVTGRSLGVELKGGNTHLGYRARFRSASSIMDDILAATSAPSGWTKLLTGSGYLDASRTFDDKNLWQAFLELAQVHGAYIRETATARQIEMKNVSSVSGMVLRNADRMTPEITDLEWYGLIKDMKIKRDVHEVVNRIVGVGEHQGDILLDVGMSNRGSGYPDRLSLTPTSPYISYTAQLLIPAGVREGKIEGVQVAGANRYMFIANCGPAGNSHATKWNDTVLPYADIIPHSGGTFGIAIAKLRHPEPTQEGVAKISFDAPTTGPISMIVVVLCDVYLVEPLYGFADAQGTSTTPITTNTGIPTSAYNTKYLLLDFLGAKNFPTATPGSGQTLLANFWEMSASSKPVDWDANEVMSWTLASSQQWVQKAYFVIPHKNWYIEDATSQADYGLSAITLVTKATKFIGASPTAKGEAANTLFDYMATMLNKLKDPPKYYEPTLAYIGNTNFLVGDSVYLDWVDPRVAADSYAGNIIVLEKTVEYPEDGTKQCSLVLSTIYAFPRSIAELIQGSALQIGDLEAA